MSMAATEPIQLDAIMPKEAYPKNNSSKSANNF